MSEPTGRWAVIGRRGPRAALGQAHRVITAVDIVVDQDRLLATIAVRAFAQPDR